MNEDEDLVTATVGDQLRAAREAAGIDLEDIAAQTRIPTRHLVAIESSDWDKLPAPTYTMGFAKSYASVVGLDRTMIADQLRAEMGGMRASVTQPEVFESADPARVMPRGLVIGALVVVALLVALLLWNQSRSLDAPDPPSAEVADVRGTPAGAAPAPLARPASGPVVLTANEAVWLQVTERGGDTLYEGELAAGQSFEVPPTAKAPLLKTARPESLRISVGTADAPSVGPAGRTVSNISLLGADLLRSPGASPATGLTPTSGNLATPIE